MARYARENPDARNFGLQSRDMAKAGLNALKEEIKSFSSIQTMSERFSQFAAFSKSELEIKDMRHLTKEHIEQYGEHLKERCEKGEISAATAQNYLSAVNRTLEIARGDRALHVAPVRDAGLPERVATRNVDQASKIVLNEQIQGRLGTQIGLQQQFGLRFEESCKINAAGALNQALTQGKVTITEGTKGGRSRDIPITNNAQIDALKSAANAQGADRSMIPSDKSYKEYRAECYQISKENNLGGFHGNRHAYAQSRYEALTCVSCPAKSNPSYPITHFEKSASALNMSVSEYKQIDREARMIISQELGHSRIDVTRVYLG